MMIALSLILAASLVLFIGSLVYATIDDNNRAQLIPVEAPGLNAVNIHFTRAARRPTRILGSFIL